MSEIRSSNPVIGKIYIEHLFTVNCIEKTKIKKKEAGNGPIFFFKKTIILNHDWPFLRLINLKCFKGWIPVGAFAKIPSKKLNCALQKISHLGTNILKLLNAWGFIPPDHVVKDGFFKWTNPGHFLFIFVLFKHKFYRKNCMLQWDSNSDRWSRRRAC